MVTSDIPHALAEDKDGFYFAGDNKNSWVGVALLQDLFIREHNYICDNIAAEAKEEGKEMTDEEIFVRTTNLYPSFDSMVMITYSHPDFVLYL
jgi:hypothetical protein